MGVWYVFTITGVFEPFIGGNLDMSFDIGKMVVCDHRDDQGIAYPNIFDCPKCAGQGEYYDLSFDNTGNLTPVEKLELLKELTVKSVLTVKGENVFHPLYGTSISALVGTTFLNSTPSTVEREVTAALTALKSRQRQQMEAGQYMSKDEVIHAFTNLSVYAFDDRTLKVSMDVIAESAKELAVQFNVSKE